MKICLYLEGSDILKFSGIGNALEQQIKALKLNNVDYTLDLTEDYDIIDIISFGPRSFFIAKKAKKLGKKVVMHTHTVHENFKNSYTLSNQVAPFLKIFLKKLYKNADLLISPGIYAKIVLRECGLKNRIEIISNGIDLKKFYYSKEKKKEYREKFNLEGIVPFSTGYLFARKGITTFTNIAKKFPQNNFIWYGRILNLYLVSSLEIRHALIEHPKNVIFTGFVKDILAAYNSGDIFFFPSHSETQGIVILEAAATNHPLLLRDIPAYRGWLTHQDNCLKAKNDEEFSEYLKLLIEDKNLREKLSKNAYKMVKKHNLKDVGKQLKQVYESLINS